MAFLLDHVLCLFLSVYGSILSFPPWYPLSVLFHIILLLLYKMRLICTHTMEHSYCKEQSAIVYFLWKPLFFMEQGYLSTYD